MRPIANAVLAACALLCLAAPALLAQDVEERLRDPDDPESGYYVFQFDEENGERLEDFIDLAKYLLLRPIKYNPTEVAETRIRIIGPIQVQKDEFYQFFQAVLKAYDFIVVNFGPPGSSFLSVQKLSAGGPGRPGAFVKAQAPIVPVEQLEKYGNDPATLITTSIPLRYIDARSAMGTFNPFFDAQIEQVRNVENSNSLVITGFGSNVWGAYQLVGLVDVPPFKPKPHIRKRELEFASVDEVEPVITELLGAAQGLRPGQTAAPQQPGSLAIREIDPRIIVDPRANALLITGEEEMVDRIESWIDILDVEVDPRGYTHVYRLQNTDASNMQEVMDRVLQDTRASQSGRSGASGAQTTAIEPEASVVADDTSNSLIITASDRRYAELVDTLRQLDVRRRQVLIEAAIVETTSTIGEIFRAGVAGGGSDAAFVSNFGTPLTPVFEEVPADSLISPDVDFPATADLLSQGASFAKISDGIVPLPLVLEWIETNTASRVLSRPSILTNDNEEAELASEVETAYQVRTVQQSGSETESFETVTAGIRLGVSPTISAGNYLRLSVRIEVSDFQDSRTGNPNAPPDITSREIEAPVTVPDGSTIILGGLVSRTSRTTEQKVPWLGDLPLVGWLFRSTTESEEDRYLYLFVTSYIIDTDFALLDEISAARKQDIERLGGDVRDLTGSISASAAPDVIEPLADLERVFDMPSVAMPATGDRPRGSGSRPTTDDAGEGRPAEDR